MAQVTPRKLAGRFTENALLPGLATGLGTLPQFELNEVIVLADADENVRARKIPAATSLADR
jgi:hypothetical protein